ncbi:MAG: DUF115 domain-containing protein [Desulforhopalus sp.]|nr:DUF115 domain-containing protein [Desulforhopalus sp.]
MSTPLEGQEIAKESAANTSNPQISLSILPDSFRNDMFEDNMAYFRESQAAIFNSMVHHTSKEYRLCSNPDGSPNIIEMKSKMPLYRAYTMENILKFIQTSINSMPCNALIIDTFIGGLDEIWKKNNPIQYGMVSKLYNEGIFKDLALSAKDLSPLKGFNNDYMPFIRLYGIGLGYHITELIKSKNISFMTIYEPHPDLFYTSLFTVPWRLIFKYFDTKGKGLNLVLGGTPENAVRSNTVFINQRLGPLTTLFYRLNHLSSSQSKELIRIEPQADAIERSQSDAGWYEDQRLGFYLSARNIRKENKFYSGKKTKLFFRAFIVGAGPSLNETLQYIKTHQQDAVIVSCGSAITPLLRAGIVPDYEVVQERVWQFEKHEEKHDLDLVKKITLLKLNVVSPRIDRFYKDTLVFQKYRDPGSSLLEGNYPVTTAVNPTVTNAGISMCAALGADEVYLFGVDYGAPKDSEKMHADNTIYDDTNIDDSVESKTHFDLPGNLGAQIKTDTVLSWSHHTTEMKIAEFPKIQWINVGEGAFIKGAAPLAPENLPVKFKKKIDKKNLLNEISACFNNKYSSSTVLNRLKTTQMQQIDEYFRALSGFTIATPQTRDEITNVLTLLYKAVNTGKEKTGYLPSSLLPYGFIQFINNVYIQCSLAKTDKSAVEFFRKAMIILEDYIANIAADLKKIMQYLELDEEIDLIETWYYSAKV